MCRDGDSQCSPRVFMVQDSTPGPRMHKSGYPPPSTNHLLSASPPTKSRPGYGRLN